MKKVFFVNGGAGRMISSLPAFQKYYKLHGPDFYIVSEAGMEFFVGHKELQDLTFPLEHKGLFESIIKPNECVSLEPYREHGYYNQKRTLAEAFDKLVNNTDDHSDLEKPKIVLSKQEEIQALDCINNVKEYHKKKKTVVFQPFGRGCQRHEKTGHVVDMSSRSFSTDDYFYISEKLRSKYNVISFSEMKFENDKNMYVDCHLRQWAAIIELLIIFLVLILWVNTWHIHLINQEQLWWDLLFQRIYLIQSTLILLKRKELKEDTLQLELEELTQI